MINIDESHPGASELLRLGAISVARSFVWGSRCAVDKTIEETIMKHSKSKCGAGSGSGMGLSGITGNENAYQRWVKTTQERAKYVADTLSMADMLSENTQGKKHKDVRPSEIQKSEKYVKKTMDTICSFMNPFETEDHEAVFCLSSGAPASKDIAKDVLRADEYGKAAKDIFITTRLKNNDLFFQPVKRSNLKTMADMNKTVRVTTSKAKSVEYRDQGNATMALLIKYQSVACKLDFHALMKFTITPLPYSIATADGYFAKTNKATGLHFVLQDVDDSMMPPPSETLVIEDGNADFYCLRVLPWVFTKKAHSIFDIVPTRPDFIFSTDMYHENSIKTQERIRRCCGPKLQITNCTKHPKEWKLFLSNSAKKDQLCHILDDVWGDGSMAERIGAREVTIIDQGRAFQITQTSGKVTKREIVSLYSTQEETDTRVVIYCLYAVEKGYKYVRVRSPDSDVFFILLHQAANINVTILFETGTGNKKRLINITVIANENTQLYSTAL